MAKARKTPLEVAQAQARISKLRASKAADDLQATRDKAHKFYLNDNLKSTRKRRTGSTTPSQAERDMTTSDRRKGIQKSRQKVMESPLVCGMVQTLVDNIVGTGYKLNMKSGNEDFDKEVERRWNLAKDKLDVRKVRPWGRLLRMWQYRKTIDGDVGINLVDGGETKISRGRGKKRPTMRLSYVQTIEGERIFKDWNTQDDVGVTFDKMGRPTKYWIGQRQNTTAKPIIPKGKSAKPKTKSKGIPAKNFILYAHYPHERAERARGVSMLLQNLNVFADMEETLDAMRIKVKNEAFMGLKFKMDAGPEGKIFPNEQTKESEDGVKRSHVNMVPGMNLNMAENEDADVLESKSPNSEFMPFYRMMMRYAGTRFGLPLEMILFDFSETNYSGGRALLELAKKRFKVEQEDLRSVASRVFQWWLAREIKHNDLPVPNGIKDTAWTHRWGVPGWPYLDPVKSANANTINLSNALTTRREIREDLGYDDWEDIPEQLEHEQKELDDREIKYGVGLSGQEIVNMDDSDEPMGNKK